MEERRTPRRRLVGIALVAAAALTAVSTAGARATGGSLKGAGSSFVYPLVSQWIPAVDSAYGIKVTYGPIGSGGGINAITARTVDFGASDAPLSKDQFAACRGCVQIPWALSATSVAYHLDGGDNHIRLNGKVLANVFLGRIKRWNDPAIRSLNKGKSLPSTPITPIHREDNSGTTYNFTEYLSSVSGTWRSRIGKGVAVDWPGGISGKGSSGVSAKLSQTNGGITYVDVAYSLKNHFKFAAVQNRAGKYQLPGIRGIKAAAATVRKVPASNELSIVNPPRSAPSAYPICTFTYVIVPLKTEKAKDLRRFIFWALTKGQSYGPKLLFVPIPKPVLVAAEKTMKRVRAGT